MTKYTFLDDENKLIRKLVVRKNNWMHKLWLQQSMEMHFKRHPNGTIISEVVNGDD
jgi:hypothetical protein